MKFARIIFQHLLLLVFMVCFFTQVKVNAQYIELTLGEAIEMAGRNSFEAFKAKNLYLDKALDHEAFTKSLYPQIDLSFTPASYSRSIQEQWDSKTGRYSPYDVQSLTSNGSITLNQPLKFTGGTLSINSSLYRYSSFSENNRNYTSYISYPLRISYSQDFSKVNAHKWKAKIAPLEFEAAKKQYIKDIEALNVKVVEMFFKLLKAEMKLRIALLNKNNTDTLYLFGQKKLEVGALSRDHYLQLQLKRVNAGIALESSIQNKEQAQMALNNFLELPRETKLKCLIPSQTTDLEIAPSVAVSKAFENSPYMATIKSDLLKAEHFVKSAKGNRFTATFSTTIGLNQNKNTFSDVYRNLRDQQLVSLSLSLPVLDWGNTKRNIKKAKLNKILVAENSRKDKEAIELEVLNMVDNLHITQRQLSAAKQADSISRLAYQAVQQQFILGKGSVFDINSAYNEMQNAQNIYLDSLMNYWHHLYALRRLCLYDFENQMDIGGDFDNMLEAYPLQQRRVSEIRFGL